VTSARARASGALRLALPAIVLAVVATLRQHDALASGALAAAAVLAALGAVRPVLADHLGATVGRVARALGRAVELVLSTAVFVLVFVPVWALGRVLGARPVRQVPGWRRHAAARRVEAADDPVADAAREPFGLSPKPRNRTLVLRASALVVAVALLAAWHRTATSPEPQLVGLGYWAPAYDGEAWARPLFEDQAGYDLLPDPLTQTRNADHEGDFEVVNGVRTSYGPEDPRLTVWVLGGSTTFGMGQRDEHTIPSELARLAEADGHPIRVVNLGVPAWSTWQEVIELERRLDAEPAPDLVVALDGVNDYSLFTELESEGRDPRWPWAIGADRDHYPAPATADRFVEGSPEREQHLRRYTGALNRGWEGAAALLAARDIPVIRFWQPHVVTLQNDATEGPIYERLGFEHGTLGPAREEYVRMGQQLEPRPVDISDAMDDLPEAPYFDWAHTNETGARAVAEAMYTQLAEPIAQLDPA